MSLTRDISGPQKHRAVHVCRSSMEERRVEGEFHGQVDCPVYSLSHRSVTSGRHIVPFISDRTIVQSPAHFEISVWSHPEYSGRHLEWSPVPFTLIHDSDIV